MMKRERLEQMMKKEKLGQMKELGRGGLTKGLTFLRNSANTALSHTGSTPSGRGSVVEELEDTASGESASAGASTSGPPSNSGPRMSYDDLVTLSMKLTRQNKLLKAQLERMLESTPDPDVDPNAGRQLAILRNFVTDVVGVDVSACAPDDEGDGSAGNLDGNLLQERYEMLRTLQQTAMKSEIERLESELKQVRATAVAGAAPVMPDYDSIDLLGDPVPSADSNPNPVVRLDGPGDAIAEQLRNELEQQKKEVEQWRSEVESLQQQLAVQEKEAQHQKEDMEQQVQQLSAVKTTLEDASKVSTERIEELVKQVETLRAELTAKEEMHRLLMEQSLPKSSEGTDTENDSGEGQEGEASTKKPVADHSVDVPKLLQELQQVCVDRAELNQQLQQVNEQLAKTEKNLRDAQTHIEQDATIIDVLRSETSRLADERVKLETEGTAASSEIAELRQQLTQLKATKETLEEQLQVVRRDSSTNLESVVTELEASKQRMAEEREQANSRAAKVEEELEASRKQYHELESMLAEKEMQHQRVTKAHAALTRENMELQAQVATMQEDLQIAAEGLEAHATRAEECDAERQEAEDELQKLQKELETFRDQHLGDLELLRSEKERELDNVKQERRVAMTKLQESQAERDSLVAQIAELRSEYEQKNQHAVELESRISELTAEVGNLSVDLAETKKALSDRMAMATRLRTENMNFAEKQAEQAAKVESAMRDVVASRQQQEELRAETKEAKRQMHKLEEERDAAVARMEEMLEQSERDKEQWTTMLEQAEAQHRTALDAEKSACKQEIERVENEAKQKSKLALHAVLEKEAEIARLTARLNELEEDVRSGGADNRKIFEFAQLQANREMETRVNNAKIQNLTAELQDAQERVQELEAAQARHDEELAHMLQTQRRDGVNMEYLKNIIVQYMSFKPGSSQQLRLIPVISTLLEFNPTDLKTIKKASRRSASSWTSWGTETTPEIKLTAPSPSQARQSQQYAMSTPSLAAPAPDGTSSRLSSFAVPGDGESVADGAHGGRRAEF